MGRPSVLSVEQNTPWVASGVQADDILVSVDGQDTTAMAQGDLVRLLRGASHFEFKRPSGSNITRPEVVGTVPATEQPVVPPSPGISSAVASKAALSVAPAVPMQGSSPGNLPFSKQGTSMPFLPPGSLAAFGVARPSTPRIIGPRVIPPRVGGAGIGCMSSRPVVPKMPAIDPNDHRESLPTDAEMEAWLELLRDGCCQQMRWQNSYPEPPPYHRAMRHAATPGEKIPEGKYPRDALNLQFQMLLGMRTGSAAGSSSASGMRPPFGAASACAGTSSPGGFACAAAAAVRALSPGGGMNKAL